MGFAKTILIIVVAGYVGLLLLLYVLQDRFIFFPTREIFATPDQRGLDYRDVELVAADGVRLHAWWVPVPKPRATVLYLHGNGGCLSHTLDAIETFARLGLSVLAIDYRGYGRSEGKPSGDGIMRDAEAAWDYLTGSLRIPERSIVLVGRSLGGGPASALAARNDPAALILESTFTSVADRAAEQFRMFPVRTVVRVRFDNRLSLSSVRCPVMIVHSTDDETIPYHHGRELYEAAGEPKELVTISHSHNECYAMCADVYVGAIDRFVTRHVANP